MIRRVQLQATEKQEEIGKFQMILPKFITFPAVLAENLS